MPTAAEFRKHEEQARKDAAEYAEWSKSRPDVERKTMYERWADTRLADAEFYASRAERLERMEKVK